MSLSMPQSILYPRLLQEISTFYIADNEASFHLEIWLNLHIRFLPPKISSQKKDNVTDYLINKNKCQRSEISISLLSFHIA